MRSYHEYIHQETVQPKREVWINNKQPPSNNQKIYDELDSLVNFLKYLKKN